MKKLLLIALSFVSFSVCSQNIAELEKENSTLDAQRSIIQLLKKNISREYDSILAIKDLDIKKLKLVLIPIKKSIDSLNQIIALFGISENNLNMYNLLKKENVINTTTKKHNSFYKQLKKEFSFSQDQKFLIVQDFICLEVFDAKGRLYSFDKITLTSDQIEKQKKLLSKGSILYLKENDLFLENLTGVNANHLSLLQQMKALNQRLEIINNDIDNIEAFKKKLSLSCERNKTKLDNDYDQISTSITEINNQITSINEQTRVEKQKLINYSKFKTKNVNGIEICTTPLTVREFRNGDEIKLAITPGQFRDYNNEGIPACHYKYFDEKNKHLGLHYNAYALSDPREIAPNGFHKLNLFDFLDLKNHVIYSKDEATICSLCSNGLLEERVTCSYCNNWTEAQKTHINCPSCKGKQLIYTGRKIKHTFCNGTGKLKFPSMWMRNQSFYLLASKSNNLKSLDEVMIDSEGRLIDAYNVNSPPSLLIVKDKKNNYSDTFQFYRIGDLELMKTLLKVDQFKNGDKIKRIEDPIEWELAIMNKIPAYCSNEKTGGGFLYNTHALKDNRGLIPKNWRLLNDNDIFNINYYLDQFEYKSTSISNEKLPMLGQSYYSPIKSEIFLRDQYSDYQLLKNYDAYPTNIKNDYSGYVICSRDASTIVPNRKLENAKVNISELAARSKIDQNIGLSEVFWEGETYRRGFYKDEKNLKSEKSLNSIIDYYPLYNSSGDSILDILFLNQYESLFDEHSELKLIGVSGYFDTISKNFTYEYGDKYEGGRSMFGLIIKRVEKFAEKPIFIAKVFEIDENESRIIIDTFYLNRELFFKRISNNETFYMPNISFSPTWLTFSNDPISNFHMVGTFHHFDKPGWEKSINRDKWSYKQDEQLNFVYQFLNNND